MAATTIVSRGSISVMDYRVPDDNGAADDDRPRLPAGGTCARRQ
jgi:hypothetical protein